MRQEKQRALVGLAAARHVQVGQIGKVRGRPGHEAGMKMSLYRA